MGVTLKDLGRLEEAEASYTQSIALDADFSEAFYNRSRLLFDKGDFEAALKDADACMLKKASVLRLIILYALGRIDEIYKRIEVESKTDSEVAARVAPDRLSELPTRAKERNDMELPK